MLSDESLLAGAWERLKPALALRDESLRMFLGYPGVRLSKNLLSDDKHYKNLFSYSQ